jgi:hypothetical protein
LRLALPQIILFIVVKNILIIYGILTLTANFKNIFVKNAFISHVNAQTIHIKSIIHNRIAMISLKTFYPGGIRTQVFCFFGGYDIHCATPPGHPQFLCFISCYFLFQIAVFVDLEDESIMEPCSIKV